MLRLIILLLALSLVPPLSAGGAPEPRQHPAWADFEPRFTPHICPFGAGLQYDPEEFRCGYVLVPEDRTDPDSRLVRLSVLKIASLNPAPAAGALVRLTGGPGRPSLSAGRIRAYQAPENRFIREVADLVFFDQRGVGHSGPAFCRAIPLAYQFGVATVPDGQRRLAAAMSRCLDEARAQGVAVGAYSTWHNALDVRDIRRALGYPRWNLFAVSYGTELAQAVMAVDRAGVRAAVLDSVVPLAIDPTDPHSTLAAGFRSSLRAVDAMCRQDAACARAHPSLAQDFLAVIRAYQANPMELTGVDITQARGGRLVVDATLAAGAVFQALYRREVYGDLPAVLQALQRRDPGALRAYVEQLGYAIDHRYGHGLSWVANCRGALRDRGGPRALEAIARQEPELSRWMGTIPFDTLCPQVIEAPRDPIVGTLESDIPALVVAGEADPVTPPHFARSILAGLARAQFLEFPYTGHGAIVSHFQGCGGQLLRDFLVDPEARLDASCLGAIPAPAFLTGLRATPQPLRLALQLRRQDYPLSLLATGAGLAAAVLGFPLAALARRINLEPTGPLGRARLLSWLGAVAGLAGLATAAAVVLATARNHPAALPLGVPGTIAWAGWFGLAGAGLGLSGTVLLHRGMPRRRPAGSVLAIYASAAVTGLSLWHLVRLGAGPL